MFDNAFLEETMMGPNALSIVQELTDDMALEKGMRVLDLGCGRGLTSLYLAMSCDVTVFAVDLWISATENLERINRFGLQDRIVPLQLDVHRLPFAEGYFDAVVSVDAYHYFGARERFLERYIVPLLRPGGQIGVAVPGVKSTFAAVPEELKPFWQDDMHFYPVQWWRELWSQTASVDISVAREMACLKAAWQTWLDCDNPYAIQDREMMAAEKGRCFNLVELVATVK